MEVILRPIAEIDPYKQSRQKILVLQDIPAKSIVHLVTWDAEKRLWFTDDGRVFQDKHLAGFSPDMSFAVHDH